MVLLSKFFMSLEMFPLMYFYDVRGYVGPVRSGGLTALEGIPVAAQAAPLIPLAF